MVCKHHPVIASYAAGEGEGRERGGAVVCVARSEGRCAARGAAAGLILRMSILYIAHAHVGLCRPTVCVGGHGSEWCVIITLPRYGAG